MIFMAVCAVKGAAENKAGQKFRGSACMDIQHYNISTAQLVFFRILINLP
jgi:hypothetical protein